MNLVIVESPAKAKTIGQYLGKNFVVKASYGHVRDLPKSDLGVDVEKDFRPKYVVPPRSRKAITSLKKDAVKADAIYFATDKDREGEAIAWHLVEALKPDPGKVRRITFDEITKSAIQKAMREPRTIDQKLVDAQQARRILDRLVGYELSPFLWKKVRRGLSAGRVQSVAVRLIVEREREITAFTPEEFWTVEADLESKHGTLTAKLRTKDGALLGKMAIKTREDAETIKNAVETSPWTVTAVSEKVLHRSPAAPYTTSTLQQAAANRLGFSAKKTMLLAQRLYEGVELGSEGPTGLITYMRTDSVRLASEAIERLRGIIANTFGKEFLRERERGYRTKTKGAQEAHEAIRPTDPSRAPEQVRPYLDPDMARLYELIWRHTVACQMADAVFTAMTADITAGAYGFRATGSRIAFPGYLQVLGLDSTKETILPPLTRGESLTVRAIRTLQHTTQPPPRYSEAALVKTLEENGIGRPSTYAPTIDTIQERAYVEKRPEDRRFRPTDVGMLVNDILVEHFPEIVDVQFTARMEADLDQIASGEKAMVPILKLFYEPFHENLETKTAMLKRSDLTTQATDLTCPKCGKPVIIRFGRHGKFYGCSGYPECKYTAPISEEEKRAVEAAPTGKTCPECGKELVLKRGRYGVFLGCSGYPECKHTERIENKLGVTCPKCGTGDIVERRSKRGRNFYGCNRYPDCDFVLWNKPTGEQCPRCKSPLVSQRGTIACSKKECPFEPNEAPAPSRSVEAEPNT
jgi:DNA topoisomerase-1